MESHGKKRTSTHTKHGINSLLGVPGDASTGREVCKIAHLTNKFGTFYVEESSRYYKPNYKM